MEIVGAIAEIYMSAACAIAEMWVLLIFYPKKQEVKNWEIGLWFVLSFAFEHVMILPNPVQSLLSEIINIFIAWHLLEGKRAGKTVLIIEINIFMIIWAMIESRISYFISGGNLTASITQGSNEPIRVIGILFDGSLYLLIAYIISRFSKGRLRIKKGEMVILLIFYGLFFAVVFISIAMMGDTSLNFPWYWQMAFLLLDVLMFFANFAVLYLLEQLNAQNQYETENAVLKVLLEQQERQLRREEENYQAMCQMRHDTRHYFVTFLQLLRDGEYELLQQEMEWVIGTKLTAERFRYTKNRVLNAVVNQKVQHCEAMGIPFTAEVSVDEGIEMMDIGIVVSNLLDNAIEAEKREAAERRSISLQIWMEGEMLQIIVKNYITDSVLWRNPKLETNKRKQEYHGIGLKSVKECVKEKGGEIEIFEKEHYFVVHICVPM